MRRRSSGAMKLWVGGWLSYEDRGEGWGVGGWVVDRKRQESEAVRMSYCELGFWVGWVGGWVGGWGYLAKMSSCMACFLTMSFKLSSAPLKVCLGWVGGWLGGWLS